MTTTGQYDLVTIEGDDGTMHPAEQLWTPGEDAAENGFIVLGHQRWADIIEAAAAYMARVHGWRDLHLYPGYDPSERIPRIPRAVLTYGVFLRHPHPGHGCACEWDDTWRMVWAPTTKPGAVPITAMRHPAAPTADASIPNPDEGAPATWAA
ncbi:hypothetical protein L1I79_32245 [Strepomyces sp. STD 3.1]|nr:hypothetical protein [Streptomyces sp. STD 3.1]